MMRNREELLELFAKAKRGRSAVPGLWVESFIEAEALLDAVPEPSCPVLFMVSSKRKNLKTFIKVLRCFDCKEIYIQVVGDDPEKLAIIAEEMDVDGVYLRTSTPVAAKVLCDRVGGNGIVTEILLPWSKAKPNQRLEGRIVNEEDALGVLGLEGLDIAAVPVGGGPGPYKSWRIPLWSSEVFQRIVETNPDLYYALPWGSLLPKELLKKYNLYGGALPGVVSLPRQQFKSFVAAGAVKVSFRSDLALAFLCGLRESLYRRPEQLELPQHLVRAQEGLVEFMGKRVKELQG